MNVRSFVDSVLCLGPLLLLLVWSAGNSQAQSINRGCSEGIQSAQEIVDTMASSTPGIPQDYATVATFPEAVRREIFNRSSPEVKSELWRDHLTLFLQLELDDQQRAALEAVIQAATPETFVAAQRGDAKGRRELLEKIEKLTDLVPRDIAAEMVARLGPPNTKQATNNYDPNYGCACNQHEDFCYSVMFCAPIECQKQEGCGLLWQNECNGQCCHPWHQDCPMR